MIHQWVRQSNEDEWIRESNRLENLAKNCLHEN